MHFLRAWLKISDFKEGNHQWGFHSQIKIKCFMKMGHPFQFLSEIYDIFPPSDCLQHHYGSLKNFQSASV